MSWGWGTMHPLLGMACPIHLQWGMACPIRLPSVIPFRHLPVSAGHVMEKMMSTLSRWGCHHPLVA